MQFDNIINDLLREDEVTKDDKLAALNSLRGIGTEVITDDKHHSSRHEHNIDYVEDFPQVDVSDYLQDAKSDEDIFIMHGTASVGYHIYPGQRGGWEDPSWPPYAETEEISWSNVSLVRVGPDGNERVVDPYVMGVNLYNQIIRDLKERAKDEVFREADEYLEDSNNWD